MGLHGFIGGACGLKGSLFHGAGKHRKFIQTVKLLHLYRGTGVNETLSETSVEMCLGELMQLNAAFSLEGQSEERYYLQIKRKTAYLLSASCFTGALAGGMTAAEAAQFQALLEKVLSGAQTQLEEGTDT